MCGIVAVVSPRGGVHAGSLDGALDALAHRGPDGRGVWVSPDGAVAMGHVRLAVRDLEGGAQPLTNEDGRVVAAVNGELYGTAALVADLIARGHRFRARTDSEIVVHAWEEWGPAMVDRLRGEFAFVLWDARERVFFAARDRFGVKPLAWAEHGGRLLFASQVKGLFALGVPARWDHDSLFQCASLQYALPGTTLFAGAREVPAGHALLVRDGEARVFETWDLDYPVAARDDASPASFAASLDEAVAIRLEADVPVAFQLSGGIDSAAVLASASRQTGRALDAFTVSFSGGGAYDELDRAEAIARHVGARLHVVRVVDREIADAFPAAVLHAEGACINAHAAAKVRLSAAIRDAGFKVVLTGEGADEVLFGYAHLRSDLAGSAERVRSSNAASAGLMLPDADGIPMDAVARALGYVPTWMAAKAAFGKRTRDLARDAWRARFAERDAAAELLEAFALGRLEGWGRVERSAYLWTKLALEGYILRSLGDGLEMAGSVEGRLPFLDAVLVDRLRRMPLEAKIRDGVEKWILREAVRDRLPASVVTREKHPFLAPPMGPRMLAVARDAVASASFRDQPVFDPVKVAALLDGLPAMTDAARKAIDPVVHFVLSIAVLQARWRLT
ncbi:MAG TPA: asparagine synthase (glutamine-hydrolyzing) [Polyangiaceae bacterium]|jgi:asparagine synthase (glutamine-hydrolysing)|nr:asparagine synthase (glutamine-hydrolyzing) [Polyangiaceae bacterium]